jgi:hypothetical protein
VGAACSGEGRCGGRIDKAAEDAKKGIDDEHRLDRRQLIEAQRGEQVRDCRGQRAHGSGQRPDQAVTRKHSRAGGIGDFPRQHRMLNRHEHADAASRWIDRAGEGYHQQQRVIVHQGEGDAGRDHQAGGREQELAVIVARSKSSDDDR